MIASVNSCQPSSPVDHSAFLALLPKIERHARISFNYVRCPATREDRVAECIAVALKWYARLNERGKDVTQFRMVFVYLVAKAVKSGRRVAGMEKANDVMSEQAQRRHGFTVERLPASSSTTHEELYGDPNGQRRHDVWEERLQDNTVTPPDEQAVFRIDFAAWLKTLTPRERRLIRAMARDESTKDLARQFDLSPGRISQLRREFHDGWAAFCGDLTDNGSRCTAR
ncbi:MAG: hypothetical protein ACRELF_28010 [Gemmataceae bacterium]